MGGSSGGDGVNTDEVLSLLSDGFSKEAFYSLLKSAGLNFSEDSTLKVNATDVFETLGKTFGGLNVDLFK